MARPAVILPVLLVLLVVASRPNPNRATPPVSVGFTVSVVADPPAGPAPLLVSFNATPSVGDASTARWQFGDGASWNGSGPRALTPSHSYSSPGVFLATVTVTEGVSSASGSTEVDVQASALMVGVVANVTNGTAPLSVSFEGSASGGSGTYSSVNWSFGDGGVGASAVLVHTFRTAGFYDVVLTVTDSNGVRGTGSVFIRVNSALLPARPAPITPLIEYGIPVGLALLAFVGVLALRRRPTSPSPPEGAFGLAVGIDDPAIAAASPAPGPPPAPVAGPPPSGAAAVAAPGSAKIDPRPISREVVVFLYRLGRLGPDDLPTSDWTQKGMGERLGVSQNALSNVLRRFEAAGIVTTRVEHVRGRPRRVKTYYLTGAGERLARNLRRPPSR